MSEIGKGLMSALSRIEPADDFSNAGRSLLQLTPFCGVMTMSVSCGQVTSASCASTTGCALDDSGECGVDFTQVDMPEEALNDSNFVEMTAMTTSCKAKNETQCSADITCEFDDFDGSSDFGSGYPGTEGCEATCEGNHIVETQCKGMASCEWHEGKCWSAVGSNPCADAPTASPHDEESDAPMASPHDEESDAPMASPHDEESDAPMCSTGPYLIFWLLDKCPTMATVIAKMLAAEGITQAQVQIIADAAGFTISTEFLAELDAQGVAAASTYLSTAESCDTFELDLTCDLAESEAACPTGCEWVAGDVDANDVDYQSDRCATPQAKKMSLQYSFLNARAALIPARTVCAPFSETACTGACGWGSISYDDDSDSESSCTLSGPMAQSILIADGADPYIKGYFTYLFNSGVTCPAETDATKCNALDGCMYGESEYDEEGVEACYSPELVAMLVVNNKCSGSTADALVAMVNSNKEEGAADVTIADLYKQFGVVDLSDASKLNAQADIKIKAAADATTTATKDKDAVLAASANLATEDKAKLEFLAAAAISGETVKKVVVTISADTEADACTTSFTKMGLTSDDGACTATATSERRRNLLAASYSTTVLLNPAKVDTAAATEAIAKIKADSTVTGVTATDASPVTEIEAIPNIDATSVATFKASANTAAAANVEASAYEAEVASASASSCYSDETTIVPECECHSSCETCGYNSMPNAEDDCITCASSGDNLHVVYGDGTGTCSAYQTNEIGCTNAYNWVTCDYILTDTACNANPQCLWKDDDGDLYCGLAADDYEVSETDNLAAEGALKSDYDTCYSKGSESANCDGDCSWNEDNSSCDVSVTKTENVLEAADANGGITALLMSVAFTDINCAHRATTGIACEAVDGCALQTIGAQSRCYISQVKHIGTVETKCGTNGAAARSTAQAAAGISATCAVNEYVLSNACTTCAGGTTNALGDDASGADTACDATKCAVNEYVKSKVCTACAAGSTNALGDDASGADTECDADAAVKDDYSSASRSDISFATIAMVIATLLACATV